MATSTIVIVPCSEVCVWETGGAHSATQITPATIATIAMCSVRPACSPSIRSAATSSTSRPIARAGCTTTSGASVSASTCSGHPSTVSPVPSSHRERRSRPSKRAARRYCSRGASLASVAWKAIPRL
jgi:hypothetical protein